MRSQPRRQSDGPHGITSGLHKLCTLFHWKFPKIVFLTLNTKYLQLGRLILLQLQCARTVCSFICCIGMICKNAASIVAFLIKKSIKYYGGSWNQTPPMITRLSITTSTPPTDMLIILHRSNVTFSNYGEIILLPHPKCLLFIFVIFLFDLNTLNVPFRLAYWWGICENISSMLVF